MVAWQGLNVWATQAMVDLGYSLGTALLFTFTLTGAAVAGSFLSAWAADRRGCALVAVLTAACTLAGLLGMLALPPSIVTTASCIALMGIGGHSTMNLIHTTTADIYPLPVRATALGWSNGTAFIGAFLGPVIGGAAVASGGAQGLFTAFDAAAAICLVAVFVLYLTDRASNSKAADAISDGTPAGEPSAGVKASA
ncbi:MFS family permease [Rhodococcus opacus]|nr:MFS family permease [Rhodococcus opacus]